MGVQGPFLALQQFLPILVTLANLWYFAIFRGSPCPFPFLSVEFCSICYSCYFCHICRSIFSHSMKNSCYFITIFAKFADLLKPFLIFPLSRCRILWNLLFLLFFAIFVAQSFHIGRKILVNFAIFAKFADISKPFLTFSLSKCRILWNLLFLLFLPYLLLNLFT